LNELVLAWADEKGILETGTVQGQLGKLHEEFSELETAIAFEDMEEVADAIGDMQVVLIILAELVGMDANECLAGAYDVISQRKGEMVNGVFVKEE